MGTIDIDYTSLGVGLLLLLIPVYFLWRFKTGLLKPILIGAVRMIIQLFFIGVYPVSYTHLTLPTILLV